MLRLFQSIGGSAVCAALFLAFTSTKILAMQPVAQPVDVDEELHCLALNLYFEARSEPTNGTIAVGNVVMNRVADEAFPNTVCEVIRQGGQERNRCQFSWWCDGRSDEPKDKQSWQHSRSLAFLVYWGFVKDITKGSMWYHAKYVKPRWRRRLKRGPEIGSHIFYRMPKAPAHEIIRLSALKLGARF